MQPHQFLHVFHLLVHGKLHSPKDVGYHLLADEIMVVECPSGTGFPTFGRRFGYIVQQSRPTQPKVTGLFADVIEHFERMVEIILMRSAIAGFNALQGNQLREDKLQQAGTV